jgi:hypothetical protein
MWNYKRVLAGAQMMVQWLLQLWDTPSHEWVFADQKAATSSPPSHKHYAYATPSIVVMGTHGKAWLLEIRDKLKSYDVFLASMNSISLLKHCAVPLRQPDNVRPLCWLYKDIDSAFCEHRARASVNKRENSTSIYSIMRFLDARLGLSCVFQGRPWKTMDDDEWIRNNGQSTITTSCLWSD